MTEGGHGSKGREAEGNQGRITRLEFQLDATKETIGGLRTEIEAINRYTKDELQKFRDLFGEARLKKQIERIAREVAEAAAESLERRFDEHVQRCDEQVTILDEIKIQSETVTAQFTDAKQEIEEIRQEVADTREAVAHLSKLETEINDLKQQILQLQQAAAARDAPTRPAGDQPEESSRLRSDLEALKHDVEALKSQSGRNDTLEDLKVFALEVRDVGVRAYNLA
jgi:chromosome segregation ATPase